MTPAELKRRLKALTDDLSGLGLDQETIMSVVQTAQKAEQKAEQTGIAYKAQTVYQLPDGSPAVIQDGQIVPLVAYKAPMAPTEMIEAGTTEAMDGAAEETEDAAEAEDEEEMLLGPADIRAIAEAVAAAVLGQMDAMTTKLGAFEEEMKARGYTRMKEAVDTLAPRLDVIERALQTLVGDLPAGGHRASQSTATAVTVDDPTVAAAKANGRAKAAPRTTIEAIAETLPPHLGGFTGPWPFDVTPPAGVNLDQHTGGQD